MAKSAEINVVGLPVVKQMLADRDRVIARLLDGWEPYVRDVTHAMPVRHWFRPRGPIVELDPEVEPMSDGEAAVIRAHQA